MKVSIALIFAYQIVFDSGFPRNAFSAKSRSQSHPEFHAGFRARFRKRGLEKNPQGNPY